MWREAATILGAALPLVLYWAINTLRFKRFRQFANLPQPKSHLLWGHIRVMTEYMKLGPRDRHIDAVMYDVVRDLDGSPNGSGTGVVKGVPPPVAFLDFRPFTYPMLLVTSHEVAEQISRATRAWPYSMPKSPTMKHLIPLMGRQSIVTAQGEEWKRLRKRFNSGFSPQYLMTLLPRIHAMTERFIGHLDRFAATGEIFSLSELMTNLTFDIIGTVVLDFDFKTQFSSEQSAELIKIYKGIGHSYNDNAQSWLTRNDPFRVRRRRKLGARLEELLTEVIRDKYKELRAARASGHESASQRSILALSLADYDAPELDAETLQATCDQVKSFLFAGHDTTATLLQWAVYEVSLWPDALASLRAELDGLLGTDTSPAAVAAKVLAPGSEDLLSGSRMPYTCAVIKETLRLYPPAGTARLSPKGSGFMVHVPDPKGGPGQDICLDGMLVYNCATIIQRDRAVYGESAEYFRPERWLAAGNVETSAAATNGGIDGYADGTPATGGESSAKQSIPASAWRPFERGPRNCIGQELANLEARVILSWIMRRYDFIKVGIGELDLDAAGKPQLDDNGRYRVKSELYNVRRITSKPVDGTMMRVKMRHM